jgi:transcriptional regulator NrdR family protein
MAVNKNMYERASKAKRLKNILVCENCGIEALDTTDSRMVMGTRRRRRICLECGYKSTTYEISKEDFEMLLEGSE